VFGLIKVPSFLAENEPLARQILQVHGWAALLLLALIGLHVGAALRDRFVRHEALAAGLLSAVRRPRIVRALYEAAYTGRLIRKFLPVLGISCLSWKSPF
jgi:hypothetical protein